MSQPTVPAPSLDPADVDRVIQAVRFELYRENIYGALEILEAAHGARPDPRYAEQTARIRSWLGHLESREAYVAAQEQQYKGLRWRMGLKLLEKRIRMLSGRKTRKMIERRGRDPEFQQLEREVDAVKPARVLDAGSGEGGVAMALCARHPELTVDGVEVSHTNVRIARQLNRWKAASFRQGLAEEAHEYFAAGRFDLAYSFAVLEHVRDVDATVRSILAVLRPGGRFCFVVPMNEFVVDGDLPECQHDDGVAGHVRVFSESLLRERFGRLPGFLLEKIPAPLPRHYPAAITPVEFGSFFVAVTKPGV